MLLGRGESLRHNMLAKRGVVGEGSWSQAFHALRVDTGDGNLLPAHTS